MATQVFADEELARLREFPEISREELFRYFRLTPADYRVRRSGPGPWSGRSAGRGCRVVHAAVAGVRAGHGGFRAAGGGGSAGGSAES